MPAAFEVSLSANWPRVIHAFRHDVRPITTEEMDLMTLGAGKEMVDILHRNIEALVYGADAPSTDFAGWTDFSHPGLYVNVPGGEGYRQEKWTHTLLNSVKLDPELLGPVESRVKVFIDSADFPSYFYAKKIELGGIGTRAPSRPRPFFRTSVDEIKGLYPLRGRRTGVKIAARVNGRFA